MTLKDIKNHYDHYGITALDTMETIQYQQLLKDGAFFFADHSGAVRSTFSEEIFAANREQFDAMIKHLQAFREKMASPPEMMSEK